MMGPPNDNPTGERPLPTQRQGAGLGELPQRRCQRDDLPAAAAIPPDSVGRETGFSLGAIEGIVDSASSIVKLWSGGWSDRIGSRKGLVLFGYALAAVARPVIGIITVPWQLLVIRFSDRIGKGNSNSAPRCAYRRFRGP